jgi:hypothetical protein
VLVCARPMRLPFWAARAVASAAARRSTRALVDLKSNATANIRFALAAIILSAAYYYLLIYLLGWLNSHEKPTWWVGLFPSRLSGALAWLIALHTAAVFLAALPVAFAAVVFIRPKAILLALITAVLVSSVDVTLVLNSAFWSIIWNSHPMLFVTDHVKIAAAVPLIAWALRAAIPNKRLEQSRVGSSVNHGVDR